MSGEGGGALIGGVILIAAAPYILAGAAAVGAVVGLIKLGSAAAGAAERHHHETELKVERCSEELSGVYSRLDAALKRERDLGTAYYENLERDMQAFSKDIRCAVSSAGKPAFGAASVTEKCVSSVMLKPSRESASPFITASPPTISSGISVFSFAAFSRRSKLN